MKHITAVDFLMNKLKFIDKNAYNELYEYYEQAKGIHRNQILDAYETSWVNRNTDETPEEYYKEAYESNTNL